MSDNQGQTVSINALFDTGTQLSIVKEGANFIPIKFVVCSSDSAVIKGQTHALVCTQCKEQ